MSFELPEELKMLQAQLRRYVDAEMIPVELETCDVVTLKPEFKAKFAEDAKKLGLWLMDVPEEFGGQGMGVLATVVVTEQIARTTALPARGGHFTGPSVRAILFELSDDMKERYLYPVIRGEKLTCFGQTEPDAGSDPGSMRTFAEHADDGTDDYIINGVKRFITGAGNADFIQLMVATDREKGSHGGISCFIVDMDTPGVKLGTQYETMMGDKPWEIIFDNVRVPASQRIGAEGEGFKLGQRWLGAGRLRHGARALGVAERCIEMMTSYAKQRVTFGKPLSDRQAIQWMIADSFVELHAARLMVYHAASKADAGEEFRQEAYMSKYYADEMAFRVADRCMQVHGGIALTTDLPIERFWRQQRSFRITEGASEVMKMVIARGILRDYG
ncbi:MAG: acyl-CoA/acyl-ACP dehydrogenase [Rhodospirillales bacterium]|jgi:acyl-CoA dehydrogenase|nr:acyl-CoA/acyl-ACP dehydrogenase [Rhodospirillales bacterium]MBT4005700.1 acyl-CoA/acyl-ACP dehydrogenase [Rhodospirillales bacterium]MBT5075027.1 acyl-CoA/acyl-ACP dehydrogenase [Rhodospirillales bacterium]MBT5113355.1 acyl-CoA/acyl-ACP dehydrogenase [Rhodospirillales bacterium]MBT5672181.1 acyl-CoA/acyl-ACP dehydrogenase [Rhodospirillales bacterium]